MKTENGITMTSLIIYVIAMIIVVSIVAVISTYFYQNIDNVSDSTNAINEFTSFNSYFTEEINKTGNQPIKVKNEDNLNYIVFTSENQYTYTNGCIYFNKIRICQNISSCQFTIEEEANKNIVTVHMVIGNDFDKTEKYVFNK